MWVRGRSAERRDFFVEAGADTGHLGLGDPGRDAEGVDEVIDAAGGHTVYVGFHHHRVQGFVDAAASFEQAGEE